MQIITELGMKEGVHYSKYIWQIYKLIVSEQESHTVARKLCDAACYLAHHFST